jgi:glycosyltransferase involved in cell wall biosynthesis
VLQVLHQFPPTATWGTEILTYNLCKELLKRHEVHVFYPVVKESNGTCHINSFTDKQTGIKIHELVVGSNVIKYVTKLLKFDLIDLSSENKVIKKEFEELLKRIKPDVVSFQHLIGLSIDLPTIAKEYSKVILNFNDYWLVCPSSHFLNSKGTICTSFSPMKCWACLSDIWFILLHELQEATLGKITSHNSVSNIGFGKSVLRRAYQKYGIRLISDRAIRIKQDIGIADKILAPSRSIIGKFEQNGFLSKKQLNDGRVVILHHGVDTRNLKSVEKTASNKIRFGYIGQAIERKGLHVLVEAFCKPGLEMSELRIYGCNIRPSNEYQKCLRDKIEKNPNIRLEGRFKDISAPYSNIDVLVVPSITYEGYGLVVQEAFASKTPVIASNIGALNEFVSNMKNGLLVDVGDANDLFEKMRMISKKPSLLQQFRDNMPNVKSIEQHSKEIEKIYKEMLT